MSKKQVSKKQATMLVAGNEVEGMNFVLNTMFRSCEERETTFEQAWLPRIQNRQLFERQEAFECMQ